MRYNLNFKVFSTTYVYIIYLCNYLKKIIELFVCELYLGCTGCTKRKDMYDMFSPSTPFSLVEK